MERVFLQSKSERNTAILCLLFFVGAAVVSVYGFWSEAPPNRRVYAVIFAVAVWGTMAGLCVWGLLAYWRERLTIRDGHIVQQGVVRTKQLDLSDVTQARWKWTNNRIVLRAGDQNLTVDFNSYEQADRLWLIRFFRETIPQSVQHGWEMFCFKAALPLRDEEHRDHRPPRPDEVVFTRRRWNWYFGPFIALSAVVGGVLAWKFEMQRMLVAPLGFAALWLLLRFGTPRKGFLVKRTSAEPASLEFCLFSLSWALFGFAALGACKLFVPPTPYALVVFALLWFGGLFWGASRFDRKRQRHEREVARTAVQKWEEGEGRFGERV